MNEVIEFYSTRNPHGYMSNFSRHPITLDGEVWPTTEHYFQAMKFHPHNPVRVRIVRTADRPAKAAELGRDRAYPIREDWNKSPSAAWLPSDRSDVDDGLVRETPAEPLFVRTKDCVMYHAVKAKFTQHPNLQVSLLGTRGRGLVEKALNDSYWGIGNGRPGHPGQNKLGRILMKVRTELLRRHARSEP